MRVSGRTTRTAAIAALAGAVLCCSEPSSQNAPQGASDQRGSATEAPPRELPALPPLSDVGPIPPDEWKLLKALRGSSADTVTLMNKDVGFVLEDTIVQASARTAFITYQGGGPYRETTIRNSILKVEPGTIPLDRSYWAVRCYDMLDTRLERVEITGFGKITPKHDEGHAIYMNLGGSLTIVDSNIHHNGGQGLQLVNRPFESVLERGPAEGSIELRNTRFRENGFNPDRGGFQVSIFGTGQAVLLEDVEISAGIDSTEYHDGQTGGGLLIECEGFNPGNARRTVWWRPKELPDDWEMPFSQQRVELVRVRMKHVRPNKPLMQIKGCKELVVRDCDFRGGDIVLDHPKKPGRDCGRIVWEKNRGGARIFHRGNEIGVASDDFVIGPEGDIRRGGEDR